MDSDIELENGQLHCAMHLYPRHSEHHARQIQEVQHTR